MLPTMSSRKASKVNWMAATALAVIVIVAMENRDGVSRAAETPGAQDVRSLDNRLRSVEQRITFIEGNISRLDQRLIQTQSSPTLTRDPELSALRSEVEMLKLRLGEVECGVLRLDERTLSAPAKAAQRGPKDRCRGKAEAPIQLSSRQ